MREHHIVRWLLYLLSVNVQVEQLRETVWY